MEKEIIEVLEKLVSFKTIEGNIEEFDNIFSYIKSLIPSNLYIVEYIFNNKKAMVISNTNSKKIDIAFCSHIDVVPCEEYSIKFDEDKIFGRGTIDMKGSVAVLLYLFMKNKMSKKTALFITSDEEIDGYCAMKLLEIYKPKLGVVPDGGKNFDLIVEEKGLLQLKLSINTISAHAAETYNGMNAITGLYKIYDKLIEKYPLPQNEKDYVTSINLSKINGGDAVNKVPNYCEMILDIRHISKDSKQEIMDYIKNINNEVKVDTIASGSLFKTEINSEIERYIDISQKVLGKKINLKSCASTSDAIYFSDLNIPTILTNPEGDNPHSKDEYVTRKGLLNLYKIFLEFTK